MTNRIDELTISKNDIISDLRHIDIELKDDFEIKSNNVTGMPERMQETEIKISQTDKERIIRKITKSPNFRSFANEKELVNDKDIDQYGASDKIFNFKYPEFYSRETYIKIDNIPTRLFVSLYDDTNIIKYQRIED